MQDQFTKEFKKRNCYNGDERIKRSGVTIEMTPEQQAEFDRCADDYEYFIRNYCKIVTLDKGIQLFDLFDYQSRAISKLIDNRFVLWKWPRQMGKCQTVNTRVRIRKKGDTGNGEEQTIGELFSRGKGGDNTTS